METWKTKQMGRWGRPPSQGTGCRGHSSRVHLARGGLVTGRAGVNGSRPEGIGRQEEGARAG